MGGGGRRGLGVLGRGRRNWGLAYGGLGAFLIFYVGERKVVLFKGYSWTKNGKDYPIGKVW